MEKVNTEELMRLIRIQVSHLMRRLEIRGVIERDDLCQEAALRVLKFIDKYDPKRAKLNTFVWRYVHGAVIDYVRNISHYRRSKGESVNYYAPKELIVDLIDRKFPLIEELEESLSQRERVLCVRKLLLGLPSRLRRIIIMIYYAEMTQERVAEEIGIGCSRTSQLHREAIQKMREELAP